MKSVTVTGGGIAGLSAAVFLSERNYKVKLFESSPKLGGRAYSFFDKEKNQFFDNGQHILAGWYKNTFEYLNITGSSGNLNFQKTLEINFINQEKRLYRLNCPAVSPPYNILAGLLKFRALDFRDKTALINLKKLFAGRINADTFRNVKELLTDLKQTDNLIKYFWDPFNLAVFNTVSENISAELFLNVINRGFKEKKSSALVIPEVNLNELLIDGTVKYFRERGIEFFLNTGVSRFAVNESGKKIEFLELENGSRETSDYYICAVPFFGFRKLFEKKVFDEFGYNTEKLKSSAIISVHLFFKNRIPGKLIPENSSGMTGLTGTKVQWIFKRSDIHLSLVISGAGYLGLIEKSSEDIFEIVMNDLKMTIKGFDETALSDYRIIKEKRATFIPDKESSKYRPKQKTYLSNFYIAGDWTDTGLPATIESAVTSAKICTEEITNSF